MKRNFLIAMTAVTVALASCGEHKPETPVVKAPEGPLAGDIKLIVDTTVSHANWEGTMLGIYSHEGTVKFKDGNINIKDGKVTGGSFTINLATITPTDANYNPKEGKTAEALTGHLGSPDFFDVANYPTASFNITSVTGNEAKGTLTVRGQSHEETVKNISITPEGTNVKLTGELTFNRQNYGVAYSTGAKDKVLSDDIVIDVALVGKK